jgi:hypothetical protein
VRLLHRQHVKNRQWVSSLLHFVAFGSTPEYFEFAESGQAHRHRERQCVFAELMRTVRVCSPGQTNEALFEGGGEYRRSMYRQ